MSTPNTSLQLAEATFSTVALLEQIQSISVAIDNTEVDARGAGDRYVNTQITKQKQVIDFTGHWLNENLTPNIEASTLSVGLWTLGGTAYIGAMKSGSLDISNKGPDVSGFAVLNEFVVPTETDWTVSSGIMVVTQDALSYLNGTAVEGGFALQASIQWAKGGVAVGEGVVLPCILKSTKQSVTRGGVQMEDCVLRASAGVAQTAPTVKYNGSNETASLIYLALLGGAVCSATVDFGTNEYVAAGPPYGVITRLNYRFADKALIEQSGTIEIQGALTITEGA